MMIKDRFAYNRIFFWPLLAFVLLVASGSTFAQTTAFTYQGKLTNAGNPASGDYDLQFELYDALTGGNQVGATFNNPNVTVTSGIFTVQLDFGAAAFDGSPRFLEIGVRPAGDINPYTVLSPRQPITPTPYAIRASESTTADGLSAACINCVTSGQIQNVDGSQVTGEIPVASVPTGSGNYIQNAATPGARKTAPQPAASFNIDGDGVIGGNFGIGTEAGTMAAKLHVVGEAVFDTPLPTLHTSAAGTEQNRFIHLINSPTYRSAAGLKAGGVLVADGYSFGNPGKNDLIVKGKVAIGFGAVQSSTLYAEGSTNNAVHGSSVSGNGVYGISSSGVGVFGKSVNFEGLRGESSSTTSGGVVGYNLSTGVGVYGQSDAGTGVGARSTTGTGVDGGSTNGIGVYGISQGVNGFGGFFRNTANGGVALFVEGRAKVNILEITSGSDLAEHFELAEDAKPGMVVAIDPQQTGKLVLARGVYNRRVAGIISGAKNLSPGMVLPDIVVSEKSLPVALSGRVWVYCDASASPIKSGDLLTTSNVLGHAMKVTNYRKAQGAVIGKAMTELRSGRGLVLVLVTLQ